MVKAHLASICALDRRLKFVAGNNVITTSRTRTLSLTYRVFSCAPMGGVHSLNHIVLCRSLLTFAFSFTTFHNDNLTLDV